MSDSSSESTSDPLGPSSQPGSGDSGAGDTELAASGFRGASESLILSRMRAQGFWPAEEAIPDLAEPERSELRRLDDELGQLRRDLNQNLSQNLSHVPSQKAALAAENQRRWEESKARRAARAAARELASRQRAERWQQLRSVQVLHAGRGVSTALQDERQDRQRLEAAGLPILDDEQALSRLLGIELGTLRWLTYHRARAALVHYHRYEIPKKSGGQRAISAPKPKLAAAQQRVLAEILSRVPAHNAAHGFVPTRSVASNASPHCGQELVLNFDLKDFFPTISFARVRGAFRALGYAGRVASLLALLCTEPPRKAVQVLGATRFHAIGARVLPQGACTSPALTNLIARRLDARLSGLARHLNYRYTRYADDLTFSGARGPATGVLLELLRRVLREEGFVPNEGKTRLMGRGRRQEVTGLTVNERPTVSREERRLLRAILCNVIRHGWQAANRDGRPGFRRWLIGKVAWLRSVDPKHGAAFASLLAQALKRD